VTRTVPVWLAYTVGWLLETTYTMLGRRDEPPMTRFLVRELTTAHWFNIAAAPRDLGFEAKVSIAEGLRRLCRTPSAGGGAD
jgi:2-alkyl-3-oxoalkanoate reductase